MMRGEIVPLEKRNPERSHNSQIVRYALYEGINLAFLSWTGSKQMDTHEPFKHILAIHYCHKGRIGWKMADGNQIYLGEHDFSLHTMDSCADSAITLPNGFYEGIQIEIDLNILSEKMPALLKNTGITGDGIRNKFCKDGNVSVFIGNEETDVIFSAFYHQPKEFQLAYWRIKVIELLLYLSKLSIGTENRLSEYQSEQVERIRDIHKYLLENLSQRITIDEMASKYLINPTTLKSVFKEVYGTSIASHMKEHRMNMAARLLMETPKSIKEIAKEIGYESQSKFSKAFKEYYKVLPTEYRMIHSNKFKID